VLVEYDGDMMTIRQTQWIIILAGWFLIGLSVAIMVLPLGYVAYFIAYHSRQLAAVHDLTQAWSWWLTIARDFFRRFGLLVLVLALEGLLVLSLGKGRERMSFARGTLGYLDARGKVQMPNAELQIVVIHLWPQYVVRLATKVRTFRSFSFRTYPPAWVFRREAPANELAERISEFTGIPIKRKAASVLDPNEAVDMTDEESSGSWPPKAGHSYHTAQLGSAAVEYDGGVMTIRQPQRRMVLLVLFAVGGPMIPLLLAPISWALWILGHTQQLAAAHRLAPAWSWWAGWALLSVGMTAPLGFVGRLLWFIGKGRASVAFEYGAQGYVDGHGKRQPAAAGSEIVVAHMWRQHGVSVARRRNSEDRRKVMVEMADKAREATGRYYSPLAEEGGRFLATFSREELIAVERFMIGAIDIQERRLAEITAEEAAGA